MEQLSVGVIGAGRVGAVLAAALRQAGYRIAAVAGESDASRARIRALLPGVPVSKPTTVAKACDLLLLTVPDDALDNVVRMLVASKSIRAGQYVVHTSGLHGLAVLRPALAVGAHGIALHPALTFTGTDDDLSRLAGCVYGVTVEELDYDVVSALVASLHGRLARVDEANRPLYHAALAHGANHLVTLVTQAINLLSQAGADDPAATLRPLLSAALDNSLTSADAALTGPVVRGDVDSVREHLRVLRLSAAPSTLESYISLAKATVGFAALDGRLEPRRAAILLELLEEAGSPVGA
ncbi:MAG: Rossmann-like and DUF2520 domain-containing protein [Nocardioidaceae bacterium]